MLCLLLERPGELITREEIHRRLWPETNVEFDHGLDVLVSRLRSLLNDRGSQPRYIQTVPKRGYRWMEPARDATVRPRGIVARFASYVAIALMAAAAAMLFARTRYDRFIPAHPPHSASSQKK